MSFIFSSVFCHADVCICIHCQTGSTALVPGVPCFVQLLSHGYSPLCRVFSNQFFFPPILLALQLSIEKNPFWTKCFGNFCIYPSCSFHMFDLTKSTCKSSSSCLSASLIWFRISPSRLTCSSSLYACHSAQAFLGHFDISLGSLLMFVISNLFLVATKTSVCSKM